MAERQGFLKQDTFEAVRLVAQWRGVPNLTMIVEG